LNESRIFVMPARLSSLVAGIHVFVAAFQQQEADSRDKPGQPGHDEMRRATIASGRVHGRSDLGCG
jgi:hypothetical protein